MELIEFPVIVEVRIVAEAFSWMWTPPATAFCSTPLGTAEDASALLSLTWLSVIVSVPPTIATPPPSADWPLGGVTAAWLPVTVL